MQIVIDIPEEFGTDIGDKFQDFCKRIKAEIKHHMITGTDLVCGAYELETIEMLMQALANSTPLPKAHDNKDIAIAFQFGMAEGFVKRYDELGTVMDYYLNCVLDKIRTDIRKKMRFNAFNEGVVSFDDISKILDKYEAGSEDKE